MENDIEKSIEISEKIDVEFFRSGMAKLQDYIIDKADEVNVAIEIVSSRLKEKESRINQLENRIKTQDKDIKAAVDYAFEFNEKLKEKGKEIEKLKKNNDDLLRKLRNRVKEVKKLEKYSLYKKEFSRLNKQLQNKDKIIGLMAKYISDIRDCPFENEGKYLDCERMCDVRTDMECWKQYFENKAKEEE